MYTGRHQVRNLCVTLSWTENVESVPTLNARASVVFPGCFRVITHRGVASLCDKVNFSSDSGSISNTGPAMVKFFVWTIAHKYSCVVLCRAVKTCEPFQTASSSLPTAGSRPAAMTACCRAGVLQCRNDVTIEFKFLVWMSSVSSGP